jgi:hypothetical protein
MLNMCRTLLMCKKVVYMKASLSRRRIVEEIFMVFIQRLCPDMYLAEVKY